ncbi:hypothetical protein Tpet_1618 [Thermotoga petrophila RKU-1]|uniref:Uncharacterized protein n=1 Tax=Thermotoga petrophila (strain ATCC BAA-488 / DSM 13995 / JCM 10881 / RKU-1) TaxID=390874 RepID=A5IN51_THEP1|nr:hypothetical protein [Thermotoga petrophila]ABQ47624.1 hypothetical protein Tpet_1618 [Thermotoga petrophila RKU-1]
MRFSVMIYLLVISSLLFSGSFHKEFPLQTWNSHYPESAWGAVYSKNIVTRLVSDKVVAVNVYKTKEISTESGAGPFKDIAHTIVLMLFSTIISLMLSYVLKEAVFIENRVIENIDNVYSKIIYISGANLWRKFLTDNAAQWDEVHTEPSTFTQISFEFDLSSNFLSERFDHYTLVSTSTLYVYEEEIVNAFFEIVKNGKKLPHGASFSFGWPYE